MMSLFGNNALVVWAGYPVQAYRKCAHFPLAPKANPPYRKPVRGPFWGIACISIHPPGQKLPVKRGFLVQGKGRGDMNANELRDKTPDELKEALATLKKESFNLRFQQATGQLESTVRMRGARREAARVKTIMNEKAAAAASEV